MAHLLRKYHGGDANFCLSMLMVIPIMCSHQANSTFMNQRINSGKKEKRHMMLSGFDFFPTPHHRLGFVLQKYVVSFSF